MIRTSLLTRAAIGHFTITPEAQVVVFVGDDAELHAFPSLDAAQPLLREVSGRKRVGIYTR